LLVELYAYQTFLIVERFACWPLCLMPVKLYVYGTLHILVELYAYQMTLQPCWLELEGHR
jgi:hypothetical protein